MEKRVDVIVSHNVFFTRLGIERKHDVEDLVAKQAVAQMPIEWPKSGITLFRVRRTLLEIDRENGETVPGAFFLSRSAGKAQKLKNLQAVLSPIPIVTNKRIT